VPAETETNHVQFGARSTTATSNITLAEGRNTLRTNVAVPAVKMSKNVRTKMDLAHNGPRSMIVTKNTHSWAK